MQVHELPVRLIWPDPGQPRRDFDPEALQALAASIRSIGVRQPLHVAPDEEGWRIRDGERRWRAARLAGLETVPCLVQEAGSWLTTRQHQIVTNDLQEPLNPLEDAQALYALWLAYQIEALEREGEGPCEAFQRELGEAFSPRKQMEVLERRLCQLAGMPDVATYLASGRVRVPWQKVLEACGRGAWSADARKKHLAVLKVDPAVQDLLSGVEVSARTLRELATRDARTQQAVVERVLSHSPTAPGEALRAALARVSEHEGPVFYARRMGEDEQVETQAGERVPSPALEEATPLQAPTGWPAYTLAQVEQQLEVVLRCLDRVDSSPTPSQGARLSPLLLELTERIGIDAG